MAPWFIELQRKRDCAVWGHAYMRYFRNNRMCACVYCTVYSVYTSRCPWNMHWGVLENFATPNEYVATCQNLLSSIYSRIRCKVAEPYMYIYIYIYGDVRLIVALKCYQKRGKHAGGKSREKLFKNLTGSPWYKKDYQNKLYIYICV